MSTSAPAPAPILIDLCSDLLCCEEATARVNLSRDGKQLKSLLVCKTHLEEIRYAHKARHKDWPVIDLHIETLAS